MCILCFRFNVIWHFASPAFIFRDWSGAWVRTHYIVHRSVLLVMFSSRLEYEIPALILFLPSIQPLPQPLS